MDREPVFVDTWGWLALGHRRDTSHRQVKRLYQKLRENETPIYTTDYVLDELITLLFRRERFEEATRFVEGVLAASALGHLQIERVTPDRFFAAWDLRTRFQDKPDLSFTDVVSVVIMRERGIHHVLTQDRHFRQIGMGFTLVP